MKQRAARLHLQAAVFAVVVLGAGCSRATTTPFEAPAPVGATEQEDSGYTAEEQRLAALAASRARARGAVPASPDLAQPSTAAGTRVWRDGVLAKGTRILISTEARSLWLMRDTLVLFSAPVAVGMQEGFTWAGRTYDFTTPIGRRRVIGKDTMPVWTPPDWHYFEIAIEKNLQVVQLRAGQRVPLEDGSVIEIRGNDVGRVNSFGNFWAFTPGTEIIFDGKVFVPPFGTRQRRIGDVLGTRKLDMGNGYLIHGTNQDMSIGDAVSHGCVRMFNDDVERLYTMVPVGTSVFVF